MNLIVTESLNLSPIGFFCCRKNRPYEAPRQGTVDHSGELGIVELKKTMQFEQALTELEKFSHLWLLYWFHQNSKWKPMVQPPRSPEKKGVFATRSPYRPSPIGMTCVKLHKIEGLKLFVEGFDLLDGTPIFDIKPYIPESDSFPEAKLGWLPLPTYPVSLTEHCTHQLKLLQSLGIDQLKTFIMSQLSHDPINKQKKRVRPVRENIFELCYQTWRIHFLIDSTCEQPTITVTEITSGYNELELSLLADPIGDKHLHLSYLKMQDTQPSQSD